MLTRHVSRLSVETEAGEQPHRFEAIAGGTGRHDAAGPHGNGVEQFGSSFDETLSTVVAAAARTRGCEVSAFAALARSDPYRPLSA